MYLKLVCLVTILILLILFETLTPNKTELFTQQSKTELFDELMNNHYASIFPNKQCVV